MKPNAISRLRTQRHVARMFVQVEGSPVRRGPTVTDTRNRPEFRSVIMLPTAPEGRRQRGVRVSVRGVRRPTGSSTSRRPLFTINSCAVHLPPLRCRQPTETKRRSDRRGARRALRVAVGRTRAVDRTPPPPGATSRTAAGGSRGGSGCRERQSSGGAPAANSTPSPTGSGCWAASTPTPWPRGTTSRHRCVGGTARPGDRIV
jgi:hypothetical protein